jgi:dolichol-phosphate mannosyltransferase
VGCTGVLVNTAVLFALHGVAGLPLLLATPLAVETSILNNFWWNSRWTFASRRTSRLSSLLRYNATCLAGLVIATVTLQVLVSLAGVHYLAANLVGIGLAAVSNFLLSNGWAWRDASRGPAEPPPASVRDTA